MKTFTEKFINRGAFVPSPEFADHKSYMEDYNARKKAFESSDDEDTAGEDTKPEEVGKPAAIEQPVTGLSSGIQITVIRLSASRKAATGKYTYQYVSGIPADQMKDVHMLGRDTRANTIITSATLHGALGKPAVVTAFLVASTTKDVTSDSYGKLEVRLQRTDEDKEADNAMLESVLKDEKQLRILLSRYKGPQFARFREKLENEFAKRVAQATAVEQVMPSVGLDD